jgi:hypothetical protein
MIGGIGIFLPNIPTEASASVAREEVMQQASEKEAMVPNVLKSNSLCIAGATEERQPTKTVMEEKEKTLESSQERRKEEHSVELLKNFSKGDEQEMTAELEPATEREKTTWILLICVKIGGPGERVMVQTQCIQQVKLEIDEEEMQQQSRLQKRSQPVDQLDKEIER